MHLVLKVALFAFEIFRRVALESLGNLSAGSLVMKRSDLHYTREGSRLLTEAFVMVLTFRFAEISSRLSSLALFSVATRKAFQSDNFFDVAGVFEQMLNLILLTGAPLVLLVDLLVLFCLVVHFQRSNKANWNYAIPSVLCFMNPLLERGSPFTIPAWLYFTWRWVQLFGMAGVAFYLVAWVKKY